MDPQITISRSFFNNGVQNSNEKLPTKRNLRTSPLPHINQKTTHDYNDSMASRGENKLNNMILEIDETAIEKKLAIVDKKTPINTLNLRIKQSRQFIVRILTRQAFHYAIIILIITDLVFVVIDLALGK